MTLTKVDLFDSVYNNVGFSRTKSIQLIETLLEIMKTSLERGDDVMISGFGKFNVKEKKRRRGRNPQTGEDLYLDARRIVAFKYSPRLRDKINGKREK